jgi:hypothetical protein
MKEFAEARLPSEAGLENVQLGCFEGFTGMYRQNELFWQEWWLRSGSLLLYATYNVVEGRQDSEQADIARILDSLTNAGPD